MTAQVTGTRRGVTTSFDIAWTSDGSGAVNQVIDFRPCGGAPSGNMMGATFAQNADVSSGYAIALNDSKGRDLLDANGASVTVPGTVHLDAADLSDRAVTDLPLTLVISGAGATKSGVLTIFVR